MTECFSERGTARRSASRAETSFSPGAYLRGKNALLPLAVVVEGSSDAIIGRTLDGSVTNWNAAAEAMFGYCATEVVGQPIAALLPPEYMAEETALLDRVLDGETVPWIETTRRRKNGQIISVAFAASPILDPSGAVVGVLKIVQDLTKRPDGKPPLDERQAEREAMPPTDDMRQFVATLVHEIKQPLTAINSYAGGLRRLVASHDTERMTFAVQKIAEQTDRASAIINRLEDFVLNGMPTRKGEDLEDTILGAIELMSSVPAADGLAVKVQIAEHTTRVEIDRVQIQQVLFNLMRNAVEAMEGVPHRALTVASRPHAERMVEISVTDSGSGLLDTVLSRLFQPFATTKATGMGMGLAVCRSIVAGHGGSLWADRNPDGGAIFRFTVPREAPGETA